jgi:hypothetical protein
MATPYIPPRAPASQKFLNPDGTVTRPWVAFFNAIATQSVLGPASTVTDNAPVVWDGTSGRLVK